MKIKFFIPLIILVVLIVFFALALRQDPSQIPSPLIDKPAPSFTLPVLGQEQQTFNSESMKGQVWLLNVWASWCPNCQEEMLSLLAFSQSKILPIIGLNWKDDPTDAQNWLSRFGDPYQMSAVDKENKVGLDFGVYGAPETFLIDQRGIVRYKVIGPVTTQIIESELMPKIKELRNAD